MEGVNKGRHTCGEEVGSWGLINGKFDSRGVAIAKDLNKEIPLCSASMEVLTPRSVDGSAIFLSGQDKYLGGMHSPCGRYIYYPFSVLSFDLLSVLSLNSVPVSAASRV